MKSSVKKNKVILLIGFSPDEAEKIKEHVEGKLCIMHHEFLQWTLEDVIESCREDDYESWGEDRIVILHGYEKEEAVKIMRRIKELMPYHIIFATTTHTSLQWKLENLIDELREEDLYFSRNYGARK